MLFWAWCLDYMKYGFKNQMALSNDGYHCWFIFLSLCQFLENLMHWTVFFIIFNPSLSSSEIYPSLPYPASCLLSFILCGHLLPIKSRLSMTVLPKQESKPLTFFLSKAISTIHQCLMKNQSYDLTLCFITLDSATGHLFLQIIICKIINTFSQ